jgi:hypothetical protein
VRLCVVVSSVGRRPAVRSECVEQSAALLFGSRYIDVLLHGLARWQVPSFSLLPGCVLELERAPGEGVDGRLCGHGQRFARPLLRHTRGGGLGANGGVHSLGVRFERLDDLRDAVSPSISPTSKSNREIPSQLRVALPHAEVVYPRPSSLHRAATHLFAGVHMVELRLGRVEDGGRVRIGGGQLGDGTRWRVCGWGQRRRRWRRPPHRRRRRRTPRL